MVLNHLSGASSPGVAATVLSGVFVTAATLAVFFFEPRQRGFIHTNDLISPKKKIILSITNSLVRSSLLFIVYSTAGLASIPLSLWGSENKISNYLLAAILMCVWFEMIPLARHFGFENVVVAASVIIGFAMYFANSRRSSLYDQRSRSLIFCLRQRSSL